MKFSKLLTYAVPATAVLLSVVGCTDFDNGFDANRYNYEKNFANNFDKIDPTHDWNIATRASINVENASSSNVKIYARLNDGTYKLVGDFADVVGSKTLSFDMVKGTTDLLVTNGTSSVFAKVGGSVSFGAATRATYPATADGINVAGVSVGDYVEFNLDKYLKNVVASDGILPEEGANLGKVVQNFTYISNGAFTIYPIYWNSSSSHVLGVYWKEGNTYHYQDVYEDMDVTGAELATRTTSYSDKCSDAFPITVGMTCDAGHTISYIDSYNNKYYDLPESSYVEEDCLHPYQSSQWGSVGETCTHGYKISTAGSMTGNTPQKHMKTRAQCYDAFNNSVHVGDICPNGHTIAYIDGNNDRYQTVTHTYTGVGATAPITGLVYSKGITIDLPVGTQFGFYLKVKTNKTSYTHTLYSQGELNVAKKGDFFDTTTCPTVSGCSVTSNGLNHEGSSAWAATFQTEVNGKTVQYLCFEDWSSNVTDLNDLVFATPVTDSSTPPSIVDEEAQTWIICAEDLGNTFDVDYNDVVVEVNHVSGKEKATITPVAAGGILASYIYFNNGTEDKCLGEVHELLGQANANSGSYTPFNVSGTVDPSKCKNIEVAVSSDWSIASSTVGDAAFNAESGKAMGGFYIKVVPRGTASTEANASISGQKIQNSFTSGSENVPYVFCVPREWSRIDGSTKYSSWFRWSKEMVPLSNLTGYNAFSYNTTGHSFAEWVADKNKATDWYKYPTIDQTMGIKGITESQVSQEEQGGGSGSGEVTPNYGTEIVITDESSSQYYWSMSPSEIITAAGENADVVLTIIYTGPFTAASIMDQNWQNKVSETSNSSGVMTFEFNTSSIASYTKLCVGGTWTSGTTAVTKAYIKVKVTE